MDIVLIPCWKRADFLSVTLDYIVKADNADKNLYVFLIDRGFSSEVLDVANSFSLNKNNKTNKKDKKNKKI